MESQEVTRVGRDLAIGVDAGSTTCKMVAVNRAGAVIGRLIEPADHRIEAQVARMIEALGIAADAPVAATGYGRNRVGACQTSTEIACHAAGAFAMLQTPGVLLDMGGQDTKVIQLGRSGEVLAFAMNDKCAAGTGRFIEMILGRLKLTSEDAGRFAACGAEGVAVSSTCAVFAESEVISLLASGHPVEMIVKGIHRSLATRVASLIRSVDRDAELFMSGGVALNAGMVAALQELVGRRIRVIPNPQFVGALGAALSLLRT